MGVDLIYHGMWGICPVSLKGSLCYLIGLQVLLVIIGVFIFRTHLLLWHLLPGQDLKSAFCGKGSVSDDKLKEQRVESMYELYYSVQDCVVWDILNARFAQDVADIVMIYLI